MLDAVLGYKGNMASAKGCKTSWLKYNAQLLKMKKYYYSVQQDKKKLI
jgi:hypothetical protein